MSYRNKKTSPESAHNWPSVVGRWPIRTTPTSRYAAACGDQPHGPVALWLRASLVLSWPRWQQHQLASARTARRRRVIAGVSQIVEVEADGQALLVTWSRAIAPLHGSI
jgi:hypothetical protein